MFHLLLTLATSPPPTSGISFVNVIWLLVGVITLFFGGSIWAGFQWAKKSGIRDAKIDELIDPEKGVLFQLKAAKDQVAELQRMTKPNGLNTMEIGDVARRTELGVIALQKDHKELNAKFLEHLGESNAIQRQLWDELKRKEDKK